MKNLRNKVQLIGNLGSDPVITGDGSKKMAKLSLATSETYKNSKGEKVTDTQWHNLVAWGKIADLAEQYLTKGKRVAVEGRLINRSYEDEKGNKHYVSEVQINEFLTLSPNIKRR